MNHQLPIPFAVQRDRGGQLCLCILAVALPKPRSQNFALLFGVIELAAQLVIRLSENSQFVGQRVELATDHYCDE